MSERDEILVLLRDPRVRRLAQAVYDNIGQPCSQCGSHNAVLLSALGPFEEALVEECKTCDGTGQIKRRFDELAGGEKE